MPYSKHWRVTASGIIGDPTNPAEIFSFGFALGDPGTHTDEWIPLRGISNPLTDYSDYEDIADEVKDYFASPDVDVSQNARLRMVKIAKIDTDGKYAEAPYAKQYDAQGGAPGNGGYPPQVSLAVSMRGPVDLKRVSGRHYLPMPSFPLDSGFLISTGNAQSVAARCKTMVDNINNLQTGNRVVIASSRGFNARVVEVRVGRAYDTIRDRRNALVESYETATIA